MLLTVVDVADILTTPLKVGRCLCFDRTLGGWSLSLLLVFPGFRAPREAGAASMMPRTPAGVGRR